LGVLENDVTPPHVRHVHEGLVLPLRDRGIEALDEGARLDASLAIVGNLEPIQIARTGDGHIRLSVGERTVEVDAQVVDGGALRLMYRKRPRERERHLITDEVALEIHRPSERLWPDQLHAPRRPAPAEEAHHWVELRWRLGEQLDPCLAVLPHAPTIGLGDLCPCG